jgi:hypothetical protein
VIKSLKGADHLRVLDLYGNSINSDCIETLKALPDLNEVLLNRENFSSKEWKELHNAMKHSCVVRDGRAADEVF